MKAEVAPEYILITKLVVVDDAGRILTMRRSEDAPRRPWTWDFPGGIVEYGEQPLKAVVREAQEESGLNFAESDIKILSVVTHPRGDEYGALVFYSARHTREDIRLSYEHDSYKWVTSEEFQDLETPDVFKEIVEGL